MNELPEIRWLERAVITMMLFLAVFAVVQYLRADELAYERCMVDLRTTLDQCNLLPGAPGRSKPKE
jgi:hypothetical protein